MTVTVFCFDFQSQKFPAQAHYEAYIRFFKCYMDSTMTPQAYLEKFKNNFEILESHGETFWDSMTLRQVCGKDKFINVSQATQAQERDIKARSKELSIIIKIYLLPAV
jgi:hypothetical protein